MPLVDLVPEDTEPFIKYAPNAETRRVYGKIVFTDDTASTVAPVVKLHGFPVYVAADEASVYAKSYNAKLVDPTGLGPAAGIWYADIPVANDPSNEPNAVYATLSHPSWDREETRLVPYGTTRIRWVDLAAADPPVPSYPVWIGGGSAVGSGAGGKIIDVDVDDAANISMSKIADTGTRKAITDVQVAKLNGIQAGATANSSDASLRDFSLTTGQRSYTAISDFTEAVQDAVSQLLVGASGVTLSYNDTENSLTITGGGAGGLDAEAVRDAIGVAIVGTSPISVVVNDAADTITISLTAGATGLSLLATSTQLAALQALDLVDTSGLVKYSRVTPGQRITLRWDPAQARWEDVLGNAMTARPGGRNDLLIDFVGGTAADIPAWGNQEGDDHKIPSAA